VLQFFVGLRVLVVCLDECVDSAENLFVIDDTLAALADRPIYSGSDDLASFVICAYLIVDGLLVGLLVIWHYFLVPSQETGRYRVVIAATNQLKIKTRPPVTVVLKLFQHLRIRRAFESLRLILFDGLGFPEKPYFFSLHQMLEDFHAFFLILVVVLWIIPTVDQSL